MMIGAKNAAVPVYAVPITSFPLSAVIFTLPPVICTFSPTLIVAFNPPNNSEIKPAMASA